MTTRTRGAALIALATSLLVAACGGNTATNAPTQVPTQAPSVAPTAAPTGSNPAGSFALPSGFNADVDLEELLPDDIGGVALQKLSMSGDTFMGSGPGSEELQKTLTALGKAPADLSVAFGGNASVVIIAFRIKGADATAIFNAVVEASKNEDMADLTDVTIAGKPAKKLVDSTATATYLYLTGDAVVTITSPSAALDDATLNEIFTKLP